MGGRIRLLVKDYHSHSSQHSSRAASSSQQCHNRPAFDGRMGFLNIQRTKSGTPHSIQRIGPTSHAPMHVEIRQDCSRTPRSSFGQTEVYTCMSHSCMYTHVCMFRANACRKRGPCDTESCIPIQPAQAALFVSHEQHTASLSASHESREACLPRSLDRDREIKS